MKKISYIIILLMFSSFVVACNKEEQPAIEYAYTIDTTEESNCSESKLLYYDSENDIAYYSYCLKEIKLNTNKTTNLSDIFEENTIKIGEILNPMKLINTYDDGSSLYRDNKGTGYSKNGLSVIYCNKSYGLDNYYFGPENMIYESSLCKKKCTIVNYYEVEDFVYEETSVNVSVNLKSIYDSNDTVNVKLSAEKFKDIEIGTILEFNFSTTSDVLPEITAEELFSNYTMTLFTITEKSASELERNVYCSRY